MDMAGRKGGSRYNAGARILAIILAIMMLSSILVMIAVAIRG